MLNFLVTNTGSFLVTSNQNNVALVSGNRYLDLVNDVLGHFNEVLLTSTTFSTATGFQSVVKDYVNSGVRAIQQAEYEWPFNWREITTTLNPNQTDPQQYALDPDLESVDWESFTVVRDDTLTVAEKTLPYLDYDDWYENYRENDKAQVGSTSISTQVPNKVFRGQNGKFGVTPIPGLAVDVRYEGWFTPDKMSNYYDDTSVPSKFDDVIKNHAIGKAYAFKQNPALANMYMKWSTDGISKMRELLINRYKAIRDGRRGGAG